MCLVLWRCTGAVGVVRSGLGTALAWAVGAGRWVPEKVGVGVCVSCSHLGGGCLPGGFSS